MLRGIQFSNRSSSLISRSLLPSTTSTNGLHARWFANDPPKDNRPAQTPSSREYGPTWSRDRGSIGQEASSWYTKDYMLRTRDQERAEAQGAMGKTAKAARQAGYSFVFVLGIGVTVLGFGTLAYVVFAPSSEEYIYGKALDRVRKDKAAIEMLGEPVKALGNKSGLRGRTQGIQRWDLVKPDKGEVIRVHFHVKGSKRAGDVWVDVHKTGWLQYDFWHLVVEVPSIGKRVTLVANGKEVK